MTFEATETSRYAQPIEYITFKNGAQNWYYTNSNIIEQIGARSFNPMAYGRTEPVFSKDSSDGQIKFTVPSNIPIIEFYETMPSSFTSSVTIERVHRNDPDAGVQIFWKGVFASVQRQGDFATILAVPPMQLPAQVPRYTYSALCNWGLFQDRCGLVRQDWRFTGPVVTIGTDPAVITITGLRTGAQALADSQSPNTLTAQEIDDYWLGGYAENADGEKRAVYATDVDGVSDRIRLLQPFRNLSVTDDVTVYAGCDHTRSTCNAKFGNHLNHGGFPDIPITPIFNAELPQGGASSEKKAFYGNQ